MGKKKIKSRRKKTLIRLLFAFLVLLILLLVFLFMFREGVFNKKESEGPQKFIIDGECYVIMENVFYKIGNSDDCRKECFNDCWVRKMDFYDSKFINDSSCNSCECYCE